MKNITLKYWRAIVMTLLIALAIGAVSTVSAQDDKGKDKSTGKATHCKPHKAPVELCFICDPKLREKGRLWCKEHSRYEDRCWECHPEAWDKKRLYCKEHSLYEDECFLCHPELKKKSSDKKAK